MLFLSFIPSRLRFWIVLVAVLVAIGGLITLFFRQRIMQNGQENVTRIHTRHSNVLALAFSPDGRLIASSSNDGAVCVWDFASARAVFDVRLQSTVHALVFSKDGKTLVLGSWDGTISTRNTSDWSIRASVKGHKASVRSLACSQSQTLVSGGGSGDNSIKVWDISKMIEVRSLDGHQNSVIGLAFSGNNDSLLYSASADDSIILWDIADGRIMRKRTKAHSTATTEGVFSISCSSSGNQLSSSGADLTVRIWSDDLADVYTLTRFRQYVGFSAFLPGNKRLILSTFGGLDTTGDLVMWELEERKEIWRCDLALGGAKATALSPDGKLCAVGDSTGDIDVIKLPE
jgi:WD40 repeat protein